MTAAVLLLAAALLQGAGRDDGQPRIQRGVEVRPETVTVGDPVFVVVRIRAPRGATIEFPPTPDSGGAVEALDPVQVTPLADTAAVEQRAIYRVAPWDVGTFAIPFPEVVVTVNGVRRTVPIAGAEVVVASVLPSDSSLHVPKPPRALFTFGPPWWVWALLALAAAAVVLVCWWLWRRWRRRATVPADPWDAAEEAFARIDALGLLAAGERARHVALMIEALRDWLAAALPDAPTALTTSELVGRLRGSRAVPHAVLTRLAALLVEADLIKFARRPVSADRARELGNEARAVARAVRDATATPTLERAA